MSFNSFIAFILALSLFLGSIIIATDAYAVFLSVSSFLMVIGGTLAATFLGYEARYVALALKRMGSIIIVQKINRDILNKEVGRIIRWGYVAQSKGLKGLDDEMGKVKTDKFLGFGMELILSGYTGEEVRENLENMNETTYEREVVPADILKSMASTAPAFGMIGTLIGLIIMLSQLKGDPSALGTGLAVALNTTLYGVVFARMLLIPAASKVKQREQIARFRRSMIAEGLSMLADRKNPRYIQDRMNSFLDPDIHFDLDKQLKK